MARIGRHPLKIQGAQTEISHKNISVTSIVHIPDLIGYWEQGLEVLNLFFTSLYENTNLPFDLVVVDNCSCGEVQDYLIEKKDQGLIQILLLSEYNLKKMGALNMLLSIAPGDYIAYADSDVYFLPGWLERTLEVIESFPEAGMVSALPTVDKTRRYNRSSRTAIKTDPTILVKEGVSLVPQKYIEAHRLSLGKSKEAFDRTVGERMDTRITRDGVSAFISAQDFQFTTRREIARKVLPLEVSNEDEYYDPIYSPVFEARLDELGYWRLSTVDYLVHHIGNRPPENTGNLNWIFPDKLEDQARQKELTQKGADLKYRLLHSTRFRSILKRVHNATYSLLYKN